MVVLVVVVVMFWVVHFPNSQSVMVIQNGMCDADSGGLAIHYVSPPPLQDGHVAVVEALLEANAAADQGATLSLTEM